MSLARLDICANRINQRYRDYSLLDAGCRTMDLKKRLNNCRHYQGTDLQPGKDVLVCNLEEKLPFEDGSFDLVAALDVLEHLENPHGALKELCRVASQAVFVSLPNMYYIKFRLNFLRGRGVSGKYQFPPHPISDRHRWMLSYSEAVKFVYENAGDAVVEHEMILPARGRTKAIAEPVERWLGGVMPDLFAYGVLFEIKLAG